MDWADKLIARKVKRGKPLNTDAEYLRNQVTAQCKSNIERWQGEREFRKEAPWDAKELETQHKKEMRRLIKLRKEEDAREQFEYDYEQKGIEINADYSQIGKISSVRLPFTDEEWTDLLNKEGEFLGACCAEISRIRDILQGACREDHFIEVEDFYEAIFLAKHHGWDEKGTDPIARMIALWKKVEPDARERSNARSANLDDPTHALDVLYTSSGIICWDEIYSKEGDGKDRTFDRHMNRNFALATIQTAVRTLFFKMKELDVGPIEGYALVREDGEVGHAMSGLAVYRTKELAESICERWNKAEIAEGKRGRRKKVKPRVFNVKKARVSMEHGFQILPDDHEIVVTQDVADTPDIPKAIEI